MYINMDLFIPITYENFGILKPGDWIWDNKEIIRKVHGRSLSMDKPTITEPIGFRQIDILDLKDFGTYWNTKPFMLTNIDNRFSCDPRSWDYFEEGRFFMFKPKTGRLDDVG